jgi:hypothetical protein
VAGCSTGEEAYSLAMLFIAELEKAKKEVRIKVLRCEHDGVMGAAWMFTGVYVVHCEIYVTG